MIYVLITLTILMIVIVCILFFKLKKKQNLDQSERLKLQSEVNNLLDYKRCINIEIDALNNKRQQQQEYYDNLKITRQNEYNTWEQEQALKYSLAIADLKNKSENELIEIKYQEELAKEQIEEELAAMRHELHKKHIMFENVMEPIRTLQKETNEKQERCLKLNNKDMDDIKFLFEKVYPLLNNKQVIAKLVWQVYVQRPLNDLLNDLEIGEASGIYKITNIKNNKSYIGQSVNIKNRIISHFKGACGIASADADQKIHEVMRNEGLQNWMIEVLIICEKEDLNKNEKFYIEFFNSQKDGYNITPGGS